MRRRRSAPTRRAASGSAPGSRSTHAAQSSPRSRISSTPSGSSIVTASTVPVSQTSGGMYGLSGTSRSSSSASVSTSAPSRRQNLAAADVVLLEGDLPAAGMRADDVLGERPGVTGSAGRPDHEELAHHPRTSPSSPRTSAKPTGPVPETRDVGDGVVVVAARTTPRWPARYVPSGRGVVPRNSDRSWKYSCQSRRRSPSRGRSRPRRRRAATATPRPLGDALGQQTHQLEVLGARPHRVVLVGLVLFLGLLAAEHRLALDVGDPEVERRRARRGRPPAAASRPCPSRVHSSRSSRRAASAGDSPSSIPPPGSTA